jgi:hypothetical protein
MCAPLLLKIDLTRCKCKNVAVPLHDVPSSVLYLGLHENLLQLKRLLSIVRCSHDSIRSDLLQRRRPRNNEGCDLLACR